MLKITLKSGIPTSEKDSSETLIRASDSAAVSETLIRASEER